MDIKKEVSDKALFLTLLGDLIGEASGAEIIEIANENIGGEVMSCVVDLEQVRYMNSSGIGVLITLLTKIKNNKGKMVLVNPSEQIVKLLEITKLNTVFTIADSIEDAKSIIK